MNPATKQKGTPLSTWQRIERAHPHRVILTLFMVGSFLIFLFLMLALYFSYDPRGNYSLFLPKSFLASTALLMSSGFVFDRSLRWLKQERFDKLLYTLLYTALLAVLFVILQVAGWSQLHGSGIFLNGKASGAYLYLITGLHLIHLAMAIAWLGHTLFTVWPAAKDPVKQLIISTNPYQEIKLRMLISFWHFLSIVWVLLYLFFLYLF
ncbi:cytochrome C oxidase subunit III [Cytophagales bacterium LB-30]|uniref:Cytochrome C oxidase subunit III n=1 Tax=Shiella aurantiaca TaxID=3058365 RepID=A0ABT8F583_9BACT|nr:cytochrome C oxidase subunit III [Shiella aurantiaca]MDN4165622.1 cytochrome C oxidase subunit III [Shiella aurantiaca]